MSAFCQFDPILIEYDVKKICITAHLAENCTIQIQPKKLGFVSKKIKIFKSFWFLPNAQGPTKIFVVYLKNKHQKLAFLDLANIKRNKGTLVTAADWLPHTLHKRGLNFYHTEKISQVFGRILFSIFI